MNRHTRRFGVLAAGVFGVLSMIAPAIADTPAPPADSQAVGALTLCGHNGQQVTSGTVGTTPAFWRVIDTTAAPRGYVVGGTATLYAFQPRPEIPPAEWSSEQLSASARYSEAAHPMAASTILDESLATYLKTSPLLTAAQVVQLRIYLGAPNMPIYSLTYDASYLRIANGTWDQLNPGPDDCKTAGRSVSVETLTLPKSEFRSASASARAHPADGASSSPSPSSGSRRPSDGPSPSPTPSVSGTNGSSIGATPTSDGSTTSNTMRNIVILVAAIVVLGIAGAAALRRRP